ncbi:Non-specific serine/threonine protein kinase [Sulfidibacter corallicola]|uniref:Tetratricopeptide repeat protein n=1 Tax=Sulfidibacter corallicola TaxID=2818388 RepID=A0A8A4THX2_SULCO|nr:serine/threonine-protein kinase [Sulfidibacter corallicola]QTD49223.1 tetratricopeptide repeat protein [Sulfidibacter corallicola]
MNLQRERRILDLFKRALVLPDSEREAFVRDACGEDEDLCRTILVRLQKADEVMNTFGELSDGGTLAGMRVGPYQLLRLIGEGGMGDVYLATRQGEFSMEVAVKFLKRGVADDVIKRFQRERQIMADLSHPNIAALFDGGNTSGGRPYFVMEYVEGIPIDDYCRKHDLNLRQRLRLFRKVCRAVSFAHRNLVIHRDLKPANILVDRHGEPKLLDFGIAGWLDPSTRAQDTETIHGHRAMTLEYASPEQVKGERLTAATDIYSLGVILYELLTETRPLKIRDLPLVEAMRRICEEPPRKPSSLVFASQSDVPEMDVGTTRVSRMTHVPRWRRHIAGDLDTIVLMALQKEPSQRFPSVEALSEEIWRYLEGLPLRVRPKSWLYRTTKFAGRHRTALGVASGFLVLVFALLVTLWFQQIQLKKERDRAHVERDRAQQERQVSEIATKFLKGVFEAADPRLAEGESITADDLLAEGSLQIRGALQEYPEIRANLLDTLAEVHISQGLFAEALSFLSESEALRTSLTPGSLELAKVKHLKALVHLELADYPAAEKAVKEALTLRESALGKVHHQTYESLFLMGRITYEKGNYRQAEPLYREAIEGMARLREARDLEVDKEALLKLGAVAAPLEKRDRDLLFAEMAAEFANFLYVRVKYRQALAYQRRALELFEAYLPPRHPDIGDAQLTLAGIHVAQGRLEEGKSVYRDVLALRERTYGENHPLVADALGDLADLQMMIGEFDQSRQSMERALHIRRTRLGENHPKVWLSRQSLARLAQVGGDFETGSRELNLVLEGQRKVLGASHPDIAETLNLLGIMTFEQTRYQEGISFFRESLEMKRQFYGDEHPTVATTMDNLGLLYQELDRLTESERLHRDALEMRRRLLGEDDLDIAYSLTSLAIVQQKRGQPNEAERLAHQAVGIYRGVLGNDHPDLASGLNNWAMMLLDLNRFEEALPLLEETLTIERKVYGSEHPTIAITLTNLAGALVDLNRLEEAEQRYLEAQGTLVQNMGPDYGELLYPLRGLAKLYLVQGRVKEAEVTARKAHRLALTIFDRHNFQAVRCEKVLGLALAAQGRYAEAEPLLIHAEQVLASHRGIQTRLIRELWVTLIRVCEDLGHEEHVRQFKNLLNQ